MDQFGSFGDGMGWGGWLTMSVLMLAFWGSVIAGVVLLVRSFGNRRGMISQPGGRTAALLVLDQRLASGDIDADEYSRRRQLLSSS